MALVRCGARVLVHRSNARIGRVLLSHNNISSKVPAVVAVPPKLSRCFFSTKTRPFSAVAHDDDDDDVERGSYHPNQELDDFSARVAKAVEGASAAYTPEASAELLRDLVRTRELKFTDMRDAPDKFFLAHRLLASLGLSGFGIRFTVQFNLFAGSILGLGGPEQIAELEKMQEKGALGCFLLTEKQAGVLSGLIVETTATWCPETQDFALQTPSPSAAKNWISQGLTAELGVVVARLIVNGRDHGPHAFLMQLRDGKKLMPGIAAEDMGIKTVANDLDNARFTFENVRLPKNALLNKFADIRDDAYVQTTSERMRIEVIGQRLLTGRLAIAQAALVFAQTLHAKTEQYARTKKCNAAYGEAPLYDMPQVQDCFETSRSELGRLASFCARVEERLAACLSNDTIPDDDLVEAIAVAKITAIEGSLERVHRLRLEVGSYALMADTGFELADMLLCCKFAEGDSRILMQKLARDRLKKIGNLSLAVQNPRETFLALKLAAALKSAKGKEAQARAWTSEWRQVYALAHLICDRHINAASPSSNKKSAFDEPTVERFQDRSLRAQL